jgi:hypothetical protein
MKQCGTSTRNSSRVQLGIKFPPIIFNLKVRSHMRSDVLTAVDSKINIFGLLCRTVWYISTNVLEESAFFHLPPSEGKT